MKYLGKSDLDVFLQFLKEQSIKMVPCTEKEISELEKLASKKLPQVYLNFMKKTGNEFRIFDGSSYTMEELPILKEAANELLEENDMSERLKDEAFVFFMHQGYQFAFFNLEEGENPPIYYYVEGEGLEKIIKKNDSFTDFLIDYYNTVESLI
ncbi:SMI1/KNR4 family protein [uncultured Enterococcus sp.]|uniref:SMI1/KNR4 family protein n=1 Tax=uncultured Enterococcus sp. TaxID=167972 RepID=UPI002AA7360C|nr:SMI1/KNR4 family protein [uncultured Enterococcus sp.]